MSTPRETFRLRTRALSRRARLNILLSRLSWGLFGGLLAGLLYAFVSDLTPLPIAPLSFLGLAAAVGAAAGALSALFPRLDVRGLLIHADRFLGNRELSSTAYELAVRSKESLFSEAIIEDAARSLSTTPAARILGRPRMPTLFFLPILLAGAILLSVIPVDLAALFSPKGQADPAIQSLGEELESYGRKLQAKAQEENLPRSLQLSQELQRLGRAFQHEKIDQGEVADRMQDLEHRLAAEYEAKIRSYELRQGSGSGEGLEGGEAGKRPSSESELEKAGQGGKRTQEQAKSDQETKQLGDTLNMLADKNSSRGVPQAGDTGDRSGKPSAGDTRGSSGRIAPPDLGGRETGQSADQGAQGGAEQKGDGSKPGTMAVPDVKGPPTEFSRSSSAEEMKAQAEVGKGGSAQMLMRALPKAGRRSSAAADEALQEYRRSAETALTREEVPPTLRDSVRRYFMSIGMLANDRQGR
jgi:hypothetical protein